MASNEKPLHVKVAEALGWERCFLGRIKVGTRDLGEGAWEGFPPGVVQSAPHAWPIPLFDSHWSATGPLIFEYGISLDNRFGKGMPHPEPWQAVAWRPDDDPKEVWKADGKDPLEAVCRLIIRLAAVEKLERQA